jgi:hypothetical protein
MFTFSNINFIDLRTSFVVRLFFAACLIHGYCGPSFGESGLKTYHDAKGRFSIDYPSTMTVDASNPDEIRIFHPSASFRINIDLIKRPKKSSRDAKPFMNAVKGNLKEEFTDVKIIDEGHAANDPSQLYLLCSFTDKRGVRLTQLTQVYLAEERILQLIISDKPEGFRNLAGIIDKIRNSLKIMKSSLE